MTKSLKTKILSAEQEYENHLHLTEARWFAVYTGYKREKKVVELLSKKGITAYVPLQQLTRHYTRKTRQVELPLISCYVFVNITQAQYVPVLETQFVQRFLKIRRNLLAIPEAEIDLLRRIVGEVTNVEIDPVGLHKGDEVEVIAGQLTGLKGVLVEKLGRQKLVVELKTLGYDLLMEVNPGHLRKLQPGSLS
ncbi:UpxY family transcription antiterminator [Lewinella cohaerens]|uniref:UpxY family transcription antiterminator n=1 Tax=Lewinella cohaerens TaxID=70995 RepID=UPI00036F8610|nr:UpxY family transcription antiterminator [Lewinella cohaerens]